MTTNGNGNGHNGEAGVEERVRAALAEGSTVDLDETLRLIVGDVARVRRAALQRTIETFPQPDNNGGGNTDGR